MPNADILAHLGLFVRRGFLDAASCRLIRQEMSLGARSLALVRPLGEAVGVVDDLVRRTGVAEVAAPTTALVEARLLAIQPALEAHFGVRLTGGQGPRFYIYDEGDFFLPHQDRGTDPLAPADVQARQVSVSILLNDEAGGTDGQPYRGGALVFHGRRGARGDATFAIPLAGEEGMLVAFRSDWVHEVRPILSGQRYSIVTWFE
jgi:predicted 2-oxoglutarate/Fe(II)-dependent dioxygenase YbiX